MTTILAPIDLSTATRTGPRMFRKQILRKATIDYPTPDGKTRRVVFDDTYVQDLAAAFRDGAYDDVPFILADASNAHTMDPTRFRGWVKSVEVTPDGLDAILELSQDAADLVDRTGGKLGVSPRIKPVQHVDGRTYPKAINHVLGTLDARQQGPTLGLRPWQALDLSTENDGDVLDLTGAPYQEGGTMSRTMLDLSALSDEQRESLTQWANVHHLDLSDAEDGDTIVTPDEQDDEPVIYSDQNDDQDEDGDEDEQDDDGEGITDAELDALIDAELASAVSLSDPDDGGNLDLAALEADGAAGTHVADRRENARLRADIAARDYAAAGVPTYLIDLAAPILALSDQDNDALDLSNPTDGSALDVRGIVRDMLDAVKGTINLSSEQGHGHETDDDAGGTDLADAWVDLINN